MIIIGIENGMFIGCKSIGYVIYEENGINCRWRRCRRQLDDSGHWSRELTMTSAAAR